MPLALTPQLFVIFSGLVEEECGLHYSAADRELLEAKLVTHASELGYDSLLDYFYRLRYDDPDRQQRRALVQALVVHETYFFRELDALTHLVEHYVAPAVAARGAARVWSAACSTGEEPFTLAMLLDHRGLLDRVEIIATDISEAAIAKARAGVYGRRSLRNGHPVELAARYLEEAPKGVRVAPAIRAAVDFSVANLFDAEGVATLGRFDAIVCRNVLIYFRDARIVQLVEMLRSRLTPGGAIAVGVSESLMRFGTGLVCEERSGSFFYRSAA
jgi:chemotaxis protein methyltransferase CheR